MGPAGEDILSHYKVPPRWLLFLKLCSFKYRQEHCKVLLQQDSQCSPELLVFHVAFQQYLVRTAASCITYTD